ncbi:serine hydrolase [Nonlabens agnitus]|nr:serine hydrolase [Nonlabens agnitus]
MKKHYYITSILIIAVITMAIYPIDGYERTRIKRLKRLEKTLDSTITEYYLKPGSFKKTDEINLWLCEDTVATDSIMIVDEDFQNKMTRLFPRRGGYAITVLDITDPENMRYAEMNENSGFQPGSVGKLAVATAFFTQLAALCPDDFEVRTKLMREKVVRSGIWGVGDHHTVPIYNIEKDKLVKRQVIASDEFSLYEWVDHMLSVSNNGAASIVWREALLMKLFGDEYFDLTQEEADEYWETADKKMLSEVATELVNQPLRDLGITHDEWRLGSFFTNGPDRIARATGGSIGTPAGLMKWFIKLEQGQIVDRQSSLELKRLMYMTDRRIRYAYSSRLNDASVYFKSGSYYSGGGVKYAGTKFNYMNSVIMVEHPDGTNYIVCLMSNILGKNSAGDHMYLASAIDKAIRSED